MKRYINALLILIAVLFCYKSSPTKDIYALDTISQVENIQKFVEPNKSSIKILDVSKAPYNAVINDGKDDAEAIQKAINDSAKTPGTEVYLPNGRYDLLVPVSQDSFLQLKSKVNLIGESRDGVILSADSSKLKGTTRIIKALGVNDIFISNLTITSIKPENGKYSTDTKNNNSDSFGVDSVIHVGPSINKPSYSIAIEDVNIEHFKRSGIRIEKSHDIIVRNSEFKNATDVAGGGAGYGIVIQGTPKDPSQIARYDDCLNNLVEKCTFIGPYIRHGVLLQYYAHNNVIRNNVFKGTLLDSIDLHGEDEYSNEIYGNVISDVKNGAAIGVGNTGGTSPSNHDASGANNYIHNNIIENCREGITVIMGSPKTSIENNTIRNFTTEDTKGIVIKNAPETLVKNNTFKNNTALDFIAIYLTHDKGDPGASYTGSGDPENVVIEGNSIVSSTYGIVIDAGKNISIQNNSLSDLSSGLIIRGGENIIANNNSVLESLVIDSADNSLQLDTVKAE